MVDLVDYDILGLSLLSSPLRSNIPSATMLGPWVFEKLDPFFSGSAMEIFKGAQHEVLLVLGHPWGFTGKGPSWLFDWLYLPRFQRTTI